MSATRARSSAARGSRTAPSAFLTPPSTRISAASGNKGFTALAIMRLVELGELGLGDLVRPILGEDLPLIDDAVTIEHLLTHTSGIGDYLDEEGDGEIDDYIFSLPLHALAETEAFLPALAGFPQKFPPGERFSYCNGGYVVLALVAERVSGRTFHELVQTEVCDRAGLTGTAFLRSDDLPADAALGYLDEAGNRTNVLHLPVRGNGDGGMYFTADDLHRFWNALLDGRIVSPGSLAEMTRPRVDVPSEHKRYGMGFWLGRRSSSLILEGYDAGASFRSTAPPGDADHGHRPRQQLRGRLAGDLRPRGRDRRDRPREVRGRELTHLSGPRRPL